MHQGLAPTPPGSPRAVYTWDYVKRLKDATSIELVLKGIVTREDADLAVEYGADGVIVSNYGGRDSGRACGRRLSVCGRLWRASPLAFQS